MNRCRICKENASLKCTRCKSVYYCNRECQRIDWPTHKILCVQYINFKKKLLNARDYNRWFKIWKKLIKIHVRILFGNPRPVRNDSIEVYFDYIIYYKKLQRSEYPPDLENRCKNHVDAHIRTISKECKSRKELSQDNFQTEMTTYMMEYAPNLVDMQDGLRNMMQNPQVMQERLRAMMQNPQLMPQELRNIMPQVNTNEDELINRQASVNSQEIIRNLENFKDLLPPYVRYAIYMYNNIKCILAFVIFLFVIFVVWLFL